MLLGVDVGGTFTDAVLVLEDGAVLSAKSPSTPEDQSDGVMAAVGAVLEQAQLGAAEVRVFAHGMTVATNALLEGRGARTALVATQGFTDVVELGRQNRADLYRLCVARPAPLVPPELRYGVPERMTPEGPLKALSSRDAEQLAELLAEAQPEAVAVALLHSYCHPEHELKLAGAIARALPDVHVSLSHAVVGTFREYERAASTEVDAALSPLLARYLGRLLVRAREANLPEPAIMQSNGGLIDVGAAGSHAAWTVLSGPAAGAAGAAFVAREAGVSEALALDMGGTSCDVCVIRDGAVSELSATEIASRPLALPTLDVHTVGAGGGSIAWRDAGGALRVGPRSAGAVPGPACYGRGGCEPTVTDANLLLGYLSPGAPLAAGVELDQERAQRAVAELARTLGLEVLACAQGIVRVANAEMIRALRVLTVQRGIDPRPLALVAFGGAGPLHAAQIAEELGIETILCPRDSGVLAAVGLVVSPRRRDVQRTVMLSGAELSGAAIARVTAELGELARQALGDPRAELRSSFELRYRGQAFELAVPGGQAPEPIALRAAFEAEHEERYGYSDPAQELELVTVRVSAVLGGPRIDLRLQAGADVTHRRRAATLDGGRVELDVVSGVPSPGAVVAGPALLELPGATLLIAPGWAGTVEVNGTIRLSRTS